MTEMAVAACYSISLVIVRFLVRGLMPGCTLRAQLKNTPVIPTCQKKALQKKIMYINTSLGTPVILPDE